MVVDRPRNRVLRDEVLVELAQQSQLDTRELERHLPGGAVRRFGDELLAAHAAAAENRDHPPPPDPALGAAAQAAVSAMRDVAQGVAEALGMAPELLGRRRDVEACVRHYMATGELTDLYDGWRGPVLGDAFRRCLESARLGRGRTS
jgi:ribonuclease D